MEIFIFAFIFAFAPAIVASSRGRSAGAYFVGGLLCWPIALVVCLCKTNLKEEARRDALRREDQNRHDQLIAALALRS